MEITPLTNLDVFYCDKLVRNELQKPRATEWDRINRDTFLLRFQFLPGVFIRAKSCHLH